MTLLSDAEASDQVLASPGSPSGRDLDARGPGEAGASDYIAKPAAVESLAELVDALPPPAANSLQDASQRWPA